MSPNGLYEACPLDAEVFSVETFEKMSFSPVPAIIFNRVISGIKPHFLIKFGIRRNHGHDPENLVFPIFAIVCVRDEAGRSVHDYFLVSPKLETMAGRPHAWASRTTRPKVSVTLGKTSASQEA